MSDLTFLDSSGIRAILQFAALVRDKGVVIRNPSGHVRKILEIAGVGEGMGVRSNLRGSARALTGLRRG